MLHRRAGRGREALVAGEHRVEPLLQQHRNRFAKSVKQIGSGRVGKEAVRIWL